MTPLRRRGIEPYAYLREALTRLPHMTNRQIPEINQNHWPHHNRRALRPTVYAYYHPPIRRTSISTFPLGAI
jgi:hypothetical protein